MCADRDGGVISEDRFSGPALRAFFQLTDKWALNSEEERTLLGSPAQSTYDRWNNTRRGALPSDALERISCVLGIYKALHTMFPDEEQADSWIRRPNAAPLFGGRSALDQMLKGRMDDLHSVRQYLDAQSGCGTCQHFPNTWREISM